MAVWEDGFVVMDRVAIHSDYRLARVSVSGEPYVNVIIGLHAPGNSGPRLLRHPMGRYEAADLRRRTRGGGTP